MSAASELLKVRVCCDASMDERTPQRFFIGARKVEVLEVMDRWLATDCGYFKVSGDDLGTYILKNNVLLGDWELTLYQSRHYQPVKVTSSTGDVTV